MKRTTWFSSDWHLGHRFMALKRGYQTTKDHDSDIVFSVSQQVSKGDRLFILGDVAFTRDSLFLLNAIDCEKVLVMGNHDTLPPHLYSVVFDHVAGAFQKWNWMLTHVPIHPQELYRMEANIHGHIHKSAATGNLTHPYVNVNWDWWGRAIKRKEIQEVLKTGGTTYPSQLTSIAPRV